MIKLILSLLVSVSVFSQTESVRVLDNLTEGKPLSDTIGLVGYKFFEGGFMSTKLSKTSQFHYGIVHTNVDNFKILEVPLILKKRVSNNFYALFGAKINASVNGGFSTLQFPESAVPRMGTSLEMGLQYDVNKNFMMEMRFSLPADKNNSVYPSVMDYNNTSLFRLGSEFRF